MGAMTAHPAPPDGLLPEWAPQSGVLLTWPHEATDWSDQLAGAEACFARIARELTRRVTVLVVCRDDAHAAHVKRVIGDAGGDVARVRTYLAPSNDTWARDHGPLTVLRGGRPELLDFRFNGWGGKYPADLDDRITRTIAAQGAFGTTPLESVDLVLEGGSVEADGLGTVLTTSRCLLAPTRNPGAGRVALEGELQRWLGATRVLWLGHGGLEGDDTDGHVDTLARFADPRTIVYQGCDAADDPQRPELEAMARELAALRRADGDGYELVRLPSPRPVRDADGRRLPAGYANFLITNGAVLVPGYNDAADAKARDVLARCFPDREVIVVDCRPLIREYGSLHCVTMQLPAGVVSAEA
jgi:agmatine/peptidylarginine deiminase